MKVNLVKQKHKYACGIACASMITGKDYDEIIERFGNNFHKQGIDDDILLNYLGDMGYATVEKEITRWNEKDFARAEMLRPFASIHLVRIKLNPDSGLLHWVVMDEKGKFFCPMEWSQETIKNAWRIQKVVGIYK